MLNSWLREVKSYETVVAVVAVDAKVVAGVVVKSKAAEEDSEQVGVEVDFSIDGLDT